MIVLNHLMISELETAFLENASAEVAIGQAQYLKNLFPFLRRPTSIPMRRIGPRRIRKSFGSHLAPHEVHFLNPAIRTDDLSDQRSVFGRDMIQVFSADAVLVDARDRRGLGVGAEMMWGKMNRIPVVALAPLGSYYHKQSTSLLGVEVESWIHPFIEGLSDVIVESLEDAANWLVTALGDSPPVIQGARMDS
ncbi:MAG: hypothetical protein K940chlam8_00324 [Chlamydiae bacterium]|nr:hypothetical protein [Chlamydiota bacterium]